MELILDVTPLPYHQQIRDYLQRQQREVWEWYASNRVQDKQADAVRFELLKSTYRVDRDSQPQLYEQADQVARELGLDVSVTIYQTQNPQGLNASLAYLPNEAHIVFHGAVADTLNHQEIRALLGHELSHLLLWQGWDGEYLIVDQVLSALTCDPNADTPHLESARLFQLYSEIFCDRGALAVVQDAKTVVAMLVKVMTGVADVNAESYLRQAEEILQDPNVRADDYTHPEAYIRASAIQLWADKDPQADDKISRMIEGPLRLQQLDLLSQQRVARLTRQLIDLLLAAPWMRTDAVLAHARLFYHDYDPPSAVVGDGELVEAFADVDDSLRDYACYLLLDFVTSDRDLEEFPLAAALTHSERLGFKPRFTDIARKELRLRKKQIEKIDQDKTDLLAKAAAAIATT
ncbi:M48 family metalloprotease [Roseimaritima ulvae]|uniref:M48 family metalloprotease n=1 Tax=Roseimaritima ulvae TaxID=980254 RepID=UPI00083345E4|nr:M48 family metalloprotease [Roseimaritima ulvae]